VNESDRERRVTEVLRVVYEIAEGSRHYDGDERHTALGEIRDLVEPLLGSFPGCPACRERLWHPDAKTPTRIHIGCSVHGAFKGVANL
jgi:hypothetical protein